ncbi:MAG: inositol monophosphatase [Alphaproteobacteria bacterium]|nr:inositol monophosphatase [Alphaproteobacteria bacterium]
MTHISISAVETIIAEVAAAEIMPHFRKLAQGDIEMKGVNDPVTVADKAAETMLITRLSSLLPGSIFVGEEGCARDPSILSNFSGNQDVWVIDPIDGTSNFIAGRPEFGVMVALVRRKQTLAAWIHDPHTGHTLTAEQGSGVWLNGRKMRLAGRDPALPKLALIGSKLRAVLDKPEAAFVAAALPALGIGTASAFDYARLFTGDIVFANSVAPRASFLIYRRIKPWDHIPGLFLLAEAGGYAADFLGKPYAMQDDKCGLIVASDPKEWESLHTAFKPALGVFAEMDSV